MGTQDSLWEHKTVYENTRQFMGTHDMVDLTRNLPFDKLPLPHLIHPPAFILSPSQTETPMLHSY